MTYLVSFSYKFKSNFNAERLTPSALYAKDTGAG